MSYELTDFQQDILEPSMHQPVIVDFWAPWCGPCKTLSPILEKMAQEAEGAWKFVKVNVDVHAELAGQFGVQGIPAVFLILQGRILGHFTGVQSEQDIQKWFTENLPEEFLSPGSEQAPTSDEEDGEASLEERLAQDPENDGLKMALVLESVMTNPERAGELLNSIGETATEYDRAQQLLWLVHAIQTKPEELPEHDKIKPHYQQATQALQQADFEAAIDAYLEVLYRDRAYADDGARKAILGIFALFGRDHELPSKYFRRLEMALF